MKTIPVINSNMKTIVIFSIANLTFAISKHFYAECVLLQTAIILSCLLSQKVHLYCYNKTMGKKEWDDVWSLHFAFFTNQLPHEVKQMKLFCDSWAAQNENWTVLRFLHYLVHKIE